MKYLLIFLLMFISLKSVAQYNCLNSPYEISSVAILSSTSVVINLNKASPLVSTPSFKVGTLFTTIGGTSDLSTSFSQAAANKASITISGLTPGAQYTFTASTGILCNDINPITHEIVNEYSDNVALDFTPVLLPPDIPVSISAVATSSTNATFSWPAVAGSGVSYTVEYSTASDFSAGLQTISGITLLSQNVSGLTAGGTYYYRVKASNASGSSLPVIGTTALVLFPVPTALAASAFTTSSFTANWQTVTGATSYRLDVSADNFATTLSGYSDLTVSSTSQVVSGLSAGTSYKYRVRAVNSGGLSSNSSSITALTLPVAPLLKTTDNITTSGLRLNWNTVVSATGYQVDVSLTSNFSSLLSASNITISGTTATVTGLTSGTIYYFRVRTVNGSGASSNSSGSQITLSDVPVLLPVTTITTSSFTVSWNASTGAANYRLDVSTDNFATTLSGYNNLLVASTSQLVSGLSAGISYQFRVRAENASGVSSSTAAISVITLPSAPVLKTTDNISVSGLRINWNASTGAASYQVDVSSANDFSNPISADNVLINGTSATVSGLSSGTVYYFRVRAVNASGASSNSASSQITLSDAPTLLPATTVTTTSFTASWNGTTGADSYLMDVSTDNFSTFVSGYQNLSVSATSLQVSGLSAGISYSYRVRAANASGASANSNVISQYTLPASPTNFATSNITASTIKVSWDAMVSATEYQLEVSTAQDFSALLTNYAPKIISATLTEDIVVGLLPSTIYYLRVRAKNPAGLSDNSPIKVSNTLSSSGNNDFIIQLTEETANPDKHIAGQSQNLAINVSGGVGAVTVNLLHRKNSEQNFSSDAVTVASGKGAIGISDAWFDSFGMEYYFLASDGSGQLKQSNHHTVVLGVSNVTAPIASFGREIKNYQLVSFPYTLENNQINNVMEKVMGAYDKKKWRFSQYKNGKIVDYQEGLAVSNFTQGESYFFISGSPVDLSVGQGYSFGNSLSNSFKMSLKKGWNQIGNPFPYNLSWQSVLTDNGSPSGVGKLYVFQQSSVSFVESDKLNVFGGGLVFAENDIDIFFRTSLPVASGRVGSGSIVTADNGEAWTLPIRLKQGEVESNLSAIGMAPNASEGKDFLDQVTLPRLLSYLQLSSSLPNYEFTLARNIVPLKARHTWNFNVDTDADGPVTLSWDKDKISSLGGQLILHDRAQNVLLNMGSVSGYTAIPSSQIVIYFEKQSNTEIEKVTLGVPYPNPFHDKVNVVFDYTTNDDLAEATLFVYDLSGKEVAAVSATNKAGQGLQTLTWNGHAADGAEVPAGLYFFKLVEHSATNTSIKNGKIIKQ